MKYVFLLICLLTTVDSWSQLNFLQKSNASESDTLQVKPLKPIELGELSIRASELKFNINQEIRALISDEAIRQIESENREVILSIDKSLFETIDPQDSISGIRFLNTRQKELQLARNKIEEQKSHLIEIINQVDSLKYALIQELDQWKITRQLIIRDSTISSIPPQLTQSILFLDSTISIISKKSSSLVAVINETIDAGAQIHIQSEKTKALINKKHKKLFQKDHGTLFASGKSVDYKKEISNIFTGEFRGKLQVMMAYLAKNLVSMVLILLIYIFFHYILNQIRKKAHIHDTGFGYFYKNMLNKLIGKPVSSAIVLALFFTLFLFPDRPPVFKEFLFYLIAYPIIHILNILFDKKYSVYTYSYGVLVLGYMILQLLPAELYIYRLFLLFVAVCQTIMIIGFLQYYKSQKILSPTLKKVFFYFILLHLVLSVIGIIGNITGRITLSELATSAVFFNIFNGLAFITIAILINGLVTTGIDSYRGQQLYIFQEFGDQIKQKLVYLVNAFTLMYWIALMLSNFRILNLIFENFKNIFTYKISIGSAKFSIDDFLIFFVVVYAFSFVSKIIQIVLEKDILNRFELSKGLPHTIAMVVRYILLSAGFFLAVNAAGIPIDKFTIILGAMSVGIGFGMQNIFNNLVSGLILLFERPIQIGDTVQVGQLTGNVQSIGIRSSNIRTFEGAEVIVPNGQLVSNEVINWTLSDQQRRIEIIISVAYQSDPTQVHQLLSDILLNHKEIVKEPEAAVFFSEFGESSLNFTLLFWIGDYIQARRIKSEILFQVFKTLKENNIEIPFPQRDVHIRSSVQN